MVPLRREFDAMVAKAETLLAAGDAKSKRKAVDLYEAYLARLRAVRVLDPACGSGNFLYVALRKLKDLEHTTLTWASLRFKRPIEAFLGVGPENVMGIEINQYAAELARVTIWIGEIQWMIEHGYRFRDDPVLRPLDQIATRDALLDWTDPTHPQEAVWPDAEYIIGNPPFLGGKVLRTSLGDCEDVEGLFEGLRRSGPAGSGPRDAITRGREAQWRPCRLEAKPLRDVANWVERYRRHWDARFDRLDDYLQVLQKKEKKGAVRNR